MCVFFFTEARSIAGQSTSNFPTFGNWETTTTAAASSNTNTNANMQPQYGSYQQTQWMPNN